MSSFTSPLIVTPMPDGRRWKLVRSFTYHVGSKDSGRKVVVHRGFVTDFASVPRLLWWLISSWGRYGKAAVVHDYLYKYHVGTRREADGIFFEAMGVLNVRRWRKYPMYISVRLFGWFAWKKGG